MAQAAGRSKREGHAPKVFTYYELGKPVCYGIVNFMDSMLQELSGGIMCHPPTTDLRPYIDTDHRSLIY